MDLVPTFCEGSFSQNQQLQPSRVYLTKMLLSILPCLAAQESHRKIAMTTVAASGARNHSAADIAGFSASLAAKRSLAASNFGGQPQNHRKLAATMAASRRSRAVLRPQRPRDTELPCFQGILRGAAEKN